MALMRAVLNFVVAGALVGILGVTLAGPSMIGWDNTAGNGDGMCICGPTARRGAETLITYQMRGVAGGSLVFAIAGTVFLLKRRKKVASTPPAAPPAAPAA
ncbi:MAG: hypothetical protein JNM69_35150 [Archangium sp.]|nr:hypothetical protein [Archangium sp.]